MGGGFGEGCVCVGGGRGSPEKFSMQFTDSKSQQQSPLVAFLATTVLVIFRISLFALSHSCKFINSLLTVNSKILSLCLHKANLYHQERGRISI